MQLLLFSLLVFVWLLFEGSKGSVHYFFWKALLSAVEMSGTTQTALALANWTLFAYVYMCLYISHSYCSRTSFYFAHILDISKGTRNYLVSYRAYKHWRSFVENLKNCSKEGVSQALQAETNK